MKDQADVALLGAGKMGAALVERWAAAGRPVRVWNRTPEKANALVRPSVTAMPDVRAAVDGCSVVVSILTDGHALRDVLIGLGTVAAMKPGTLLIDFSTVDVPSSEAVATEAASRGVLYLRGGVSGTAAVVTAGNAGLLLSGPGQAIAAAGPVLDEISAHQVVVGTGEESRIIKLAANMLLAGTMQVVAEAVVMAESSGVPRGVVLDALDSTVMSSKFLTYKGSALRSRDYDATFRTADLRKDVTLALGQAAGVGVPMPVTENVRAQLDAACEQGWAEDDFLSLVRLAQRLADQPVDGVGQ
ncbi:putative 6-phosphogluconate dehydrogenase [metagenome]|uniref:Putative 6-phosphogluconate dehydrogenase n=1 Tax=metagenome TaxID=256318 RepID=A0A2P2C0F8_9ZZZZ